MNRDGSDWNLICSSLQFGYSAPVFEDRLEIEGTSDMNGSMPEVQVNSNEVLC
jgi:hypothetical protein